ncbi:MAG: hypothetical protein EZS28_007208 [Streblomastix strix]|uniref:Uncharacterized protein n=1 Tax=Streblomastix strix TaxID=222440 RepID=A0A5J4WRS4_9EUKA|nr:MAG: hypothetical protein EZS28_007208 [Streblomastix strix]
MLPSSDTYGEFYPNRTRGSILGEKNPLANLPPIDQIGNIINDIESLEQQIKELPPLAPAISVFRKEDGTQLNTLSGEVKDYAGGKHEFQKNSYFSMPIDEYTKTDWKDL